MNKITIVGAGSVGSTIAYKLASDMIASEIVLVDVKSEKALGEAMDIRQGMAFIGKVNIYAGSYADAEGSDIVIITSGVARKEGQSRLDLAKVNVGIAMDIMPRITAVAPDAKYIIVSNPVDVITYAFTKFSGLPARQIIGSGTILDTTRLRERISEYFSIDNRNVHAMVMGEHGDSSFVPWSLATIGCVPIEHYIGSVVGAESMPIPLDYAEVEDYMKRSGAKVIARKGATFYAVSLGVCHICKAILNDAHAIMTVSTIHDGEYGLNDVCLSTPVIIGKNGIEGKIVCRLTDAEQSKLEKSAAVLRDTIEFVFGN